MEKIGGISTINRRKHEYIRSNRTPMDRSQKISDWCSDCYNSFSNSIIGLYVRWLT
jgi:hypothetical protein